MKNMAFHYLYRDAGNFKKWNTIIFSNPKKLTIKWIRDEIARLLPDDLFIASQVRLLELFHYKGTSLNPDDHCFHEFSALQPTDVASDDLYGRTIDQFLEEIGNAIENGWRVFDPWESEFEKQFYEISI